MPSENEGAAYQGRSLRAASVLLRRELAERGIEAAEIDARRLLVAAIGGSTLDLLRDPDRVLTAVEAATLCEFARRRFRHEPVARVLGERGFYGRSFAITPATLDPRPCSETLIESALELATAEGWRDRPIRILDVGTGSGALLLTLLAELPLATGVGTDISTEALKVAQENCVRLGLGERAAFWERDYLEGIAETFDLLISNPPYIETEEIAGLEPEVRDFDPTAALDGGLDGLDAYRALARGLTRVVPNGWAVVEVGATQSAAVARFFEAEVGEDPSVGARLWNDLGGHVRCVAIRTQSYP